MVECVEVSGPGTFDGRASSQGFQGHPQGVDVLDVRLVEQWDTSALVRFMDHQTLMCQRGQRISNGTPTGAQLLGKVFLVQTLPGGELAGDDGVTQDRQYVVLQPETLSRPKSTGCHIHPQC